MNIIQKAALVLAAAGTAVGLGTVLAPAASAAPAPAPVPGASSAQAATAAAAPNATALAPADGYFYAYADSNYGGKYCRWVGNDTDWSSCSPGGNLRNQASSLWNNGYAGSFDDVYVYWGLSYGGAYACIGNGLAYSNLSNYVFPVGGSGVGENMNDNISSHKWVTGGC